VKFTPRPTNDFPEFIRTYYERCKAKVPQIEVIAGKWTFEDLIPGMSDFDTRFILTDDMGPQDWCDMSEAVGEVHLAMCNEFPHWARILEHLPGVNMTWEELKSEETYFPECHQWSAYFGKKETFETTIAELKKRGFTRKDEFFHLKKFFLYYGPYKRGIDPAINLGPYENKYPLHSRIMHYFNPPLQSAISVIRRDWVRGKREAFRLAREMFPHPGFIDELLSIIDQHYEVEALYREPELSKLEGKLFDYLKEVFRQLREKITIVQVENKDNPAEYREKLNKIMIDPCMQIFDSAKFSRLMKGRLKFYTKAGSFFDSKWLIQNELSRIGRSFFATPFTIYWKTFGDRENLAPLEIAKRLTGEIFTQADFFFIKRFSDLTMHGYQEGEEVEMARQIAKVMDGFYLALDKLVQAVREKNALG